MWMGGQTGFKKLIAAFRNFANAPKMIFTQKKKTCSKKSLPVIIRLVVVEHVLN